MNVLLVGNGGREHAIAEAVWRSKGAIPFAFMSARNPGIARLCQETKIGNYLDTESVVRYALDKRIDIAIIGPENPLEKGLTDGLEKNGIPTVAPSRTAAQMELNKAFARELMKNHGCDGAVEYGIFDDAAEAKRYINGMAGPVVIKPLGLTGGKGVKVVDPNLNGQLRNIEEAKSYAEKIISEGVGGHTRVLVEEKVEGEEFTVQCFVDGKNVVPSPAVQDHKFAYEGDTGPFTGGMGSYSDSDQLLPFLERKDCEKAVGIVKQAVEALKKETGAAYKGVLYGQFMLSASGPKVIEFNARFGDPEAMNVLPLLETDFVRICEQIIDGTLKSASFAKKATVCKYVVPEGYPTNPVKEEITVRENRAKTYYASVGEENGRLRMLGSRAIGILGIGDTIAEAEEMSENATRSVVGRVFHRRDIGTPALIEKRVRHMQALRNR